MFKVKLKIKIFINYNQLKSNCFNTIIFKTIPPKMKFLNKTQKHLDSDFNSTLFLLIILRVEHDDVKVIV